MQIKLNDVVFYVSFATHVAVFYGGISANFHFLLQGRFAIQVINCTTDLWLLFVTENPG